MGWLGDAARFVYAALVLNWQKTLYRRGGGAGRCPCQNPSDEPKHGLVRCDAARSWNSPGRLRPLCPLLVRTDEGWRCSVPASEVRPFWGRAATIAGSFMGGLYLAATIAVFVFLRVGHDLPVGFLDVAYPPHWNRVRSAQADRFFEHAMGAFGQGRFNEAYLALTSARQRDPSHYESGLWLARLTMFQGSFLFSDDQFAELRQRHPEHAYRTAVIYHDTLLMLQRNERLAEHALAMADADPQRAALWVRSLLFAMRLGHFSAEFAAEREELVARLSPLAQVLIRAEAEIDAGRTPAAVALLQRPFSGPLNPTYMDLQVERLDTLGERAAAQALLDAYGPLLGEFRHALAQFRFDLGAPTDFEAAASLRRVLALARDAAQVDAIGQALIARPRPEIYRRLHAELVARPELGAKADRSTYWLAGLLGGDIELATEWEKRGATTLRFPRISSVDLESRDIGDPRSPVALINSVPFPRETAMALMLKMPVPALEPLPKRAPLPTRGQT